MDLFRKKILDAKKIGEANGLQDI